MNTGSNAQAYETHVPLPAPVTGTPRPRRTRAHHRTARLVQPDATIVENCRVLNTVFANQVEVQVRLANRGILSSFGKLKVEITDPATQQVITSMVIAVQIGSGETCNITRILSASDANVWSFDQQTMYQLVVNWQADRSEHPTASRRLDFAFRQFAGEGVGRDEMFRLRNRKERLSAVLPWGCWSSTGLEPLVGRGSTAMGRAI